MRAAFSANQPALLWRATGRQDPKPEILNHPQNELIARERFDLKPTFQKICSATVRTVAWSMDKRLEKRHKRQVFRAKKKVRLSEPDIRTREQIEAAREASRADTSRGNKPRVPVSRGSFRNTFAATTGSAAKTDS